MAGGVSPDREYCGVAIITAYASRLPTLLSVALFLNISLINLARLSIGFCPVLVRVFVLQAAWADRVRARVVSQACRVQELRRP